MVLYGRAGRLTTKNGRFRPGQFCPRYVAQPASLRKPARVQILRAIGVAIVKHGSMYPTLELLLRHAISYLDMKGTDVVRNAGVIDDEDALFEDFNKLTLDESRAVLCVHMLGYVLGGTIGITELSLWTKLLIRVEELYQEERSRFAALSAAELREFIIIKCPHLTRAVQRVPDGAILPCCLPLVAT